jgi:hypothetical protein
MKLKKPIESAEHKYKQILEEYFFSIFDEKSLPSHGMDHHRRVWNNAKELTLILGEHKRILNNNIPGSLIIACYLHDLGMSVDSGVVHGLHSMELCRKFLAENELNENDFPGLLDVVLNHDNKEYPDTGKNDDLFTILSVADDLDAFGYTGIYRFLEIYILRKVPMENLGKLIRGNASKRYHHFSKTFRFAQSLVLKHNERYKLLDDFFSGYERQASTYNFNNSRPHGYCGVAELMMKAINEHHDMNNYFINTDFQCYDEVIISYFRGLKNELGIKSD